MPTLIASIIGAIIFLIIYYTIIRPNLNKDTIYCLEKMRMSVGVCGRIFYGGIVEEIICRWGLMVFLIWIAKLLGYQNVIVVWFAIILSSLLFAVGHLPGYLSVGCEKTLGFVVSIIGLNLWAGIIFGWLFWKYGLSAAIIAHILFHVIWYPFDYYHWHDLAKEK